MSSNRSQTLFLTGLFIIALITLTGCATARVSQLSPHEVYQRLSEPESDAILLDVRTPEEWLQGHIEDATLIPLDELQFRASNELPPNAEIIVYCGTGERSSAAAEYLVRKGYTNVSDMRGGLYAWANTGFPLVAGP